MDDFKPNSHRFKEEQKASTEKKRAEKVVKGSASVKKKGEIHKFADAFFSEDASNVKSFIMNDVLLPTFKKLIADAVKGTVDMFLYGETTRYSDRNSSSFRAPYVSYNKFSDRRDDRRPYGETRARNGYSYDDVILDNRGDAELVIRQLDELMETYRVVRVADLYDLVGIQHNYTDNNYGWTNIRNAEAVRLRDGRYMIQMPKALPLD